MTSLKMAAKEIIWREANNNLFTNQETILQFYSDHNEGDGAFEFNMLAELLTTLKVKRNEMNTGKRG